MDVEITGKLSTSGSRELAYPSTAHPVRLDFLQADTMFSVMAFLFPSHVFCFVFVGV